jgi:hypothetical protein
MKFEKALLDWREYLDTNHQYHSLLKQGMTIWGLVLNTQIPKYDFATCPSDFIESIAIDPRCPPHKKQFMREWFTSNGISVVESRCFGYIPAALEIFPNR